MQFSLSVTIHKEATMRHLKFLNFIIFLNPLQTVNEAKSVQTIYTKKDKRIQKVVSKKYKNAIK